MYLLCKRFLLHYTRRRFECSVPSPPSTLPLWVPVPTLAVR